MKRNILFLALAAVVAMSGATGAFAQSGSRNYKGTLSFDQPKFTKTADGKLVIEVTADLSNLDLHRQQSIIITPMLKVEDRNNPHIYVFDPLSVNGKTRYKQLVRELRFDNVVFDYEPAEFIARDNGTRQTYTFVLQAPYEPWMESAQFVFLEDVSGCAGCEVAENEYNLGQLSPSAPVVVPVKVPERDVVIVEKKDTVVVREVVYTDTSGPQPFRLSLIMPSCEQLMHKEEVFADMLNFELDKSELRRDLGQNSQKMFEIDETINRLRRDPRVANIVINVKGYASPEGDTQHNLDLSRRRAFAFIDHMRTTHGFTEQMINFSWQGEDWFGLRRMVVQSDLADKQAVLNAIDLISSPSERKARLRSISGGKTYNYLWNTYYPLLRRNEYVIGYTVRPFSVGETRMRLKSDPTQLSLYELYKLASTYPAGSYEFKEVFDIASRLYPTDDIANINASALEVEVEANDAAISRIYTINIPESWNNLGVAYFQKGMYNEAEVFFKKAAEAGLADGIFNLEQFRKWQAIRR